MEDADRLRPDLVQQSESIATSSGPALADAPSDAIATWHAGRLWLWDDDAAETIPAVLPEADQPAPQRAEPLSSRAMLDMLRSADEASSPSLRALARLLDFAQAAVAREQFYPSARRSPHGVIASWRLLVGDPRDVERLEQTAASMPGACFCADEGAGRVADRLELVEQVLDTCCDTLVRESLSKDEFFANVHDRAADPQAEAELRWISALVRDPDAIAADPSLCHVKGLDREVATLLDKVQTWTARLGDDGGDPWRLGFELLEPDSIQARELLGHDTDEDAPPLTSAAGWPLTWRLLPPVDLAGHFAPLPARQVWDQPAGSIGYVGRNAVRLRERLAAELGRAADFLPPLHRALEEGAGDASAATAPERQTHLTLSPTEAFGLTRDWAESLNDAGFDVRLPGWANSQEARVEVVMELKPGDERPGTSRIGLDALLSFDWRVAVGGEDIDVEEFRMLVRQGQPLVRRGDKWIEVDLEAAAAAAELMDRRPSGTLTLGEAFRAGFGLGEFRTSGGVAPAVRLAGLHWVDELLEQSPDKAGDVQQPEAFQGELRPYQLRGLRWMAFLDRLGLGGVLADDMGLGKTIQLIALLLNEHERAKASEEATVIPPTLLFVPTSVLGNWARELNRFAPELRILPHHGPSRLRGEAFAQAANESDVIITSYALSHRDQDDFKLVRWNRVVLDEAQKVKNPNAASSRAVRRLDAPRRIALTGTPVENHLGELWSIMDLLNPGLLGSSGEFRERFAVPIEKHGDRGRARRLREMIRPFILRRTKDEPEVAADLPDKMEMSVYCGLTTEQAAAYESVTGDMLGRIDTASGIRRRGLILSVLTKLKQICDHPALLGDASPPTGQRAVQQLARSGKATRLAEMLEEVIEEGEKALVFTQYRKMGDLLVEMLQARLGRRVDFLHGGTPQPKREEMVLDFQNTRPGEGADVFLLSLRAGGLGLNLTAATHVFHYDRWWNPAVENQATDRAYRIGQTKRVQVHKFVTLGTVEERIDKMLAEKTALAQNIVGSGDDWLTELSTGELREYLSLNRSMPAST
ncbi:MAG: DEAD/DEAH box helicase, partial [Planctomycetota bacterium]